jgi:hypothetical protein
MTHNPYAALSQKKFRGDPSRLIKDNSSETKEKNDKPQKRVSEKPAEKKPDSGQPNEKKREPKVITLKEEVVPAESIRSPDPSPPTKKEREQKDKHEDRGGKGDRERKSGVGVGGWTDDLASQIREGEKAVHDRIERENPDGEETVNASEKKEEEEKPTMTVEEYNRLKTERNKLATSNFTVRKVDTSQLKGLVQAKKVEEEYFKTSKPVPKTASAPRKMPAAADTTNIKRKDEEEKKAELNLGFKYKSGNGGGRGRGRGRNEHSTEDDDHPRRGRGRGRGRGYTDETSEEKTSQFPILKDTDFPSLS